MTSNSARETVAAVISGVILIVAMWAFVSTFDSGRRAFQNASTAAAEKEAYERQKDLLIIAMGLLGTVTGYYLGRVPAELRATNAQQALTATSGLLNEATKDNARTKAEARAAADEALRLLNAQPLARRDATLTAPSTTAVADATQVLERLRDRL